MFNIFLVLWEVCYTFITLPVILFPACIISIFLVFSIRVVLFMLRLLCGVGYKIEGMQNIPNQPFIIASKHQSPFETFIFILLFQKAVFILKRELKWIPFVGLHLMALKMIFIDRSNSIGSIRYIIKSAKVHIKNNRNIIIFPEGMRTTGKQKVKYQPGIAALYSALSIPVLPVTLNTGLFWPKSILSLRRKPGKATIKILPPIYPGLNKDELLQKLEKVIERKI